MAWFQEWFDTEYYHLLYNDRDYAEGERFLSQLITHLELPPKARIIDLACGKGRHSVYLAKAGFDVLGVDLSANSIQHNQQFSHEHLRFCVHDMREPLLNHVTEEKVDAVFNLFTSFGYFDQVEEDMAVFRFVTEALQTGGYFVLDFLNGTYVKKKLIPQEVVQKGETTFYISRKITDDQVQKDICFFGDGQPKHYTEKVKLHSSEEIAHLATASGLEVQEVFGNYELATFDAETSPRCIFVFKKLS